MSSLLVYKPANLFIIVSKYFFPIPLLKISSVTISADVFLYQPEFPWLNSSNIYLLTLLNADTFSFASHDMLEKGGLLTEFLSGTNPDRHNFISRNRIVAGMCDATIIIESAEKGGSLITAELAEGYHRDCFAFPGRMSDEYSKGCNRLIRDNKASLLLSAEDFVQAMGWNMQTTLSEKVSVQRSLFIELSEEEQKIVAILGKLGNLQINSLVVEADIPVNKMTALLFELEMKGVIRVLAGGMYQLLN